MLLVDWMSACVVPLYKGKGDKYECVNFRSISLLSVEEMYGRVQKVLYMKNNEALEEDEAVWIRCLL